MVRLDLLLALSLSASIASAQPVDEAAREAEIFGDDDGEAAREADIVSNGDGETAREAEIFGDGEDNPSSDEETRESQLFGDTDAAATDSTDSLEDRMAEALEVIDASTDIGGQVYLRLDLNTAPYRYNVDDEGEIADDELFSSPNLADFYLDARPTDRLRAYVRGRFRYDPTVSDASRVFGQALERDSITLDQLWLKFDIFEIAYLTIGQQAIRWGSGRLWNPTDFLHKQRRDPLAVFDERTGVNLVKVHFPIESLGWNFYAVADLDGVGNPEDIGAAVRGEFLFGETEIAVSGAWRDENPLRFGLDVTTGFWLIDLRVEVSLMHGLKTPFWGGDYLLDFENLEIALPTERSREDDWILQGVAGAEITFNYTDDDAAIIGVEYFYNDTGYKTNRLYSWLFAQGQLDPLYVGRHYLAVFLMLAAPLSFDDSTIILTGVGNLNDLSFLTRLDYRVRVLTRLDFYLYGTWHFGNEGVFRLGFEGIEIPGRGEPVIDRALETQGIDSATAVALERGLPTAEFEAGLGLRLSF